MIQIYGLQIFNNMVISLRIFSITDFFTKYDFIRSFRRILSHLLKKSLMKNFIFCAVTLAALTENLSIVTRILESLGGCLMELCVSDF